jgi:hypothetical protein
MWPGERVGQHRQAEPQGLAVRRWRTGSAAFVLATLPGHFYRSLAALR